MFSSFKSRLICQGHVVKEGEYFDLCNLAREYINQYGGIITVSIYKPSYKSWYVKFRNNGPIKKEY